MLRLWVCELIVDSRSRWFGRFLQRGVSEISWYHMPVFSCNLAFRRLEFSPEGSGKKGD